MTNEQLIAALRELPPSSRAVIRFIGGQDFEISGVDANDIVPDDVNAHPDMRVINGVTAIIVDGR